MSGIYGAPFRVELHPTLPAVQEAVHPISASTVGCRIGIDLGGSDRKAAAVMDGETVYAEEVVWQPKSAGDLRYHYEGITAALRAAKAHLPGVDAVGISTAGVVLEGEIRRSSLFMSVPTAELDHCGRELLRRAVPGGLRGCSLRRVQRRRCGGSGRGREPGAAEAPGHRHGHQPGGGLCGRRRTHYRLAQ